MTKHFPKYSEGKGGNANIELDLSKLRLLILHITTQKFNKLIAWNCTARLTWFKQECLATKADSNDFVEKADFDDKLKKITSNNTKHILLENKQGELSEKVELISKKVLKKDLINGYNILKGENIFVQAYYKII